MQIICHTCHAVGHKSQNCPQRSKSGKGVHRGGRAYSIGSGKKYSGRRGGKENYVGKHGGGRGGGGQKGGNKDKYHIKTNNSRTCNVCNKSDHIGKIVPMRETLPKC